MPADRPSTIFFPLRTSVELFEDRHSPAAVVRAKEAAVLYDLIVCETGLLDVTVSTGGGTQFWYPPEWLTDEVRARARQVHRLGGPVRVLFGKEATPGVQAEQMNLMLEGSLNVQYVAEFHTGILDELLPLKPEWLFIADGGENPGIGDPVGSRIDQLNFRDKSDRTLMTDADRWVRDYVVKSFNRDATIAAVEGAAFSITSLFEPMVRRAEIVADFPGANQLAIAVPYVGELPWEVIMEFRDHEGSREARMLMREFDQRAAEMEPREAYEYGAGVTPNIMRALAEAMDDQRRGLPEELAKEMVKRAVSFVPVVGPGVELVSSLAQLGIDARRARRDWTAALMTLIRAQPR